MQQFTTEQLEQLIYLITNRMSYVATLENRDEEFTDLLNLASAAHRALLSQKAKPT